MTPLPMGTRGKARGSRIRHAQCRPRGTITRHHVDTTRQDLEPYYRRIDSLDDSLAMEGNCKRAGAGFGKNEMYPCFDRRAEIASLYACGVLSLSGKPPCASLGAYRSAHHSQQGPLVANALCTSRVCSMECNDS